MKNNGITVRHAPRSSLWQASCDRLECSWHSRKRVEYSDADREGYEHFKVKHQYDEWRARTRPTASVEFEFKNVDPELFSLMTGYTIEQLGDGVVRAVSSDGRVMLGFDPAQKGTGMRNRKDIEAEAKQLERRLSSLVDELAEIDSLPAEPGPEGTIVRFEVRYSPASPTYTYAALKARGSWWLTGKEKGGRSWHELLEFMSQDWRVDGDGQPILFHVFTPDIGRIVTQETKR